MDKENGLPKNEAPKNNEIEQRLDKFVSLHIRLLRGGDDLNPDSANAAKAELDQLQTIDKRDVAIFERASGENREEYWDGKHNNDYNKQMEDWKASATNYIISKKDTSSAAFYTSLGINFDSIDAGAFYDKYFTGVDKTSQIKAFVGDMIQACKTDGTFDYQKLAQYEKEIKGLSTMFGMDVGKGIAQLVIAEAQLQDEGKKNELATAGSESRINALTDEEKDILRPIWEKGQIPVRPATSTTSQPPPASEPDIVEGVFRTLDDDQATNVGDTSAGAPVSTGGAPKSEARPHTKVPIPRKTVVPTGTYDAPQPPEPPKPPVREEIKFVQGRPLIDQVREGIQNSSAEVVYGEIAPQDLARELQASSKLFSLEDFKDNPSVQKAGLQSVDLARFNASIESSRLVLAGKVIADVKKGISIHTEPTFTVVMVNDGRGGVMLVKERKVHNPEIKDLDWRLGFFKGMLEEKIGGINNYMQTGINKLLGDTGSAIRYQIAGQNLHFEFRNAHPKPMEPVASPPPEPPKPLEFEGPEEFFTDAGGAVYLALNASGLPEDLKAKVLDQLRPLKEGIPIGQEIALLAKSEQDVSGIVRQYYGKGGDEGKLSTEASKVLAVIQKEKEDLINPPPPEPAAPAAQPATPSEATTSLPQNEPTEWVTGVGKVTAVGLDGTRKVIGKNVRIHAKTGGVSVGGTVGDGSGGWSASFDMSKVQRLENEAGEVIYDKAEMEARKAVSAPKPPEVPPPPEPPAPPEPSKPIEKDVIAVWPKLHTQGPVAAPPPEPVVPTIIPVEASAAAIDPAEIQRRKELNDRGNTAIREVINTKYDPSRQIFIVLQNGDRVPVISDPDRVIAGQFITLEGRYEGKGDFRLGAVSKLEYENGEVLFDRKQFETNLSAQPAAQPAEAPVEPAAPDVSTLPFSEPPVATETLDQTAAVGQADTETGERPGGVKEEILKQLEKAREDKKLSVAGISLYNTLFSKDPFSHAEDYPESVVRFMAPVILELRKDTPVERRQEVLHQALTHVDDLLAQDAKKGHFESDPFEVGSLESLRTHINNLLQPLLRQTAAVGPVEEAVANIPPAPVKPESLPPEPTSGPMTGIQLANNLSDFVNLSQGFSREYREPMYDYISQLEKATSDQERLDALKAINKTAGVMEEEFLNEGNTSQVEFARKIKDELNKYFASRADAG